MLVFRIVQIIGLQNQDLLIELLPIMAEAITFSLKAVTQFQKQFIDMFIQPKVFLLVYLLLVTFFLLVVDS